MIHKENTFQGVGGINLFYQSWLPDGNLKAAGIIVHGGGDHSGRFGNVVNQLVPEQFAVYAFDWRGHGRSPGVRGHVNGWHELRDDLGIFIRLVNELHPDIPMFLFGHSMGGVIVLDYCLKELVGEGKKGNMVDRENKGNKGNVDVGVVGEKENVHDYVNISGMVCTSPAIGELGISPILWQIAKMLNKVWPSLSMSTGLNISMLTHDQDFVDYTKNDPLYHRKATPRFGMEVEKTVNFIHQNAAEFSLPMLLIHGTADEIVSIEGSRKFVSNSKNPRLQYKEYDGGYHELFNDTMKGQVMEDIVGWLNVQCS